MPDNRDSLSRFREAGVAGVVEAETALALSWFHSQERSRAVLLAGQPGGQVRRDSPLWRCR